MTKRTIETKFYEFRQNNSGGHFDVDENLAHHVWIEAGSLPEAVAKAEDIGIYFNGCASGRDCDCCGDRRSEPWSDNGHTEEEMRAEIESNRKGGYDRWTDPAVYIHFYDGTKEAVPSSDNRYIDKKRQFNG